MDASSEDSASEELYKNPDDEFLHRKAPSTSEKESPKSRKGRKGTVGKAKKRRRLTLTKKEVSLVIKHVKGIPFGELLEHVKTRFMESTNDQVKQVIEVLMKDSNLFQVLILHHQTTFLDLYEKLATGRKGQEKYIQFQVQWYNHCSIFLAPKKLNITSIITNPSDETYSTLLLWRNFCDSSSQPLQQCQNAVIHLSSFVYDYLLQKTHSFKAMSMPDSSSSSKCSSEAPVDNDDVYYHFGGAIISEMLHVRYKSIKKCSESRRCLISEEITILQAINSKDKSSMPA